MRSQVALTRPLVDVGWLAAHLEDPALVLLDASITREAQPDGSNRYISSAERFAADGHIPGARFADVKAELSDASSEFNFTLPAPDALAASFRRLGVGRASTVVVYDDDRAQWAARVWWLLRSIGHSEVAVLNGGTRAWIGAGHALEHGPSLAVEPGDLLADEQPGFFIAHAAVKALAGSERAGSGLAGSERAGTLVCALDSAVFTGERASGAERPGHIPGSRNLPYSALLDADGRIDPTRVDAVMSAAGLDSEAPVLAYCGGGINAAGLALALAAAGHEQVSIYDGSLQQWAADPETAMETGR